MCLEEEMLAQSSTFVISLLSCIIILSVNGQEEVSVI